MNTNLRRMAAILLFALLGAGFAHEGNQHIMGKVTAITADSITIETTKKETKTVVFDKDTKFNKSGNTATVADLKVGDKVVVDVHDMGGKLHASLVRFGAPAKAGAQAKEKHGSH